MMSPRLVCLIAICALAAPALITAQSPRPSQQTANRAPDKNATQIMISTFKSNVRANGPTHLGELAAEEMRRQVTDAFPPGQVYIVPGKVLNNLNPTLGDGYFPTRTWALEPHDAKALATMLRADEFVMGEITKSGKRFRVTADLVLTRNLALRQPLGNREASNMRDAIEPLVKELKAARKQLDGEKKCTKAAREQQWAQAIEFANAAVVAYPKATLARMCLLSVLDASGAPTAEVLTLARELVTLDPRSNVGLSHLARAYRANGETDSLVTVLTRMMRNDPRNAELSNDAINEISRANHPEIARPIIDSAIALNPGDLDLLKIRWRILEALKDWKEMRVQGEQILSRDPAFADTTYFQRTAMSFAADSQWQAAAAVAFQGVARFPTNEMLVRLEREFRQRAGRPEQAMDVVHHRDNRPASPQATPKTLLVAAGHHAQSRPRMSPASN